MADQPDRNDPCHCGSGKKYKNCCLDKNDSPLKSNLQIAGLAVAVIIGLLILGMTLFGGEDTPDCPPGSNWSVTHQHCH
ncbi:SEC-C motif-containing protein [Fodinibius roseus]|uniref:SEC-C motif-containing protein n=1 Tax=Fodinibius roseus TaxID=1194090 RepID=A0A1M4UER1_9BACT|nr:SEC-C metal-binding domain-containing protein [Fodinibius roseus]SHE55262.1 SEC-C motif-containing protein [Fodinibius roseus]